MYIRVNLSLVWVLAGIIGGIYYFSVWLFWKILIGYSQLYIICSPYHQCASTIILQIKETPWKSLQ